MAKKIIVKVRGASVEISDPDDLPRALAELGFVRGVPKPAPKPTVLEESREDLFVALRMVLEADKRPVPASMLASAMGCTSSKAMAGAVQRWREAARSIGFDLEDLLVRGRKRDHRVWSAGPKAKKASEILLKARLTE